MHLQHDSWVHCDLATMGVWAALCAPCGGQSQSATTGPAASVFLFHLDVPASTSKSICSFWELRELCTCVSVIHCNAPWSVSTSPGGGLRAVGVASGGSGHSECSGSGVWVPGRHCSLEWGTARGWPKWGAVKFGAQNWGSRCPRLQSNTDFGNVRWASRVSGCFVLKNS